MKKKHWMIGLVVLGIIAIGIVLWQGFEKDEDKSSEEQKESIYDKEDDETDFVPFSTEEEDVSDEQKGEASDKTEASGSSNVGDSKTPSSGDSNTSNADESKIPNSGETSDTSSDSPENDSDTEEKPESNNGTELPFVPFD